MNNKFLSGWRIKKPICASIVAATSFLVVGCEVPNPKPGEIVPHGAGISASTVTRNISYGPHSMNRLDLYLPRNRTITPTPVIIFVHGGGWTTGSRDAIVGAGGPISNMLNQGWAVASISYRLAGPNSKHPDQIHDVKRSIRWMKVNASRYGLDPDAVAVAGSSAGAHLALLAATSAGVMEPTFTGSMSNVNSRPIAAVSMSAPTDLPAFALSFDFRVNVAALMGCPRSNPVCNPQTNHMLNPMSHADPSDPPIYIAHGDKDWVVPPSPHATIAYQQMKSRIGEYRVWYDYVEGGDHLLAGTNAFMVADFLNRARTGNI